MLFILVLALVGFAVLFFSMPKYLVYYKDHLKMSVPFLQDGQVDEAFQVTESSGPAPYAGAANADVQIVAPDYTNVDLGSDKGLDYFQALFVPYSKVTETGLAAAVQEAQRKDIKGLLLEVKNETGMLAWMSDVDYGSSYATNGTWDLTAAIAELKEQGWFLAAQISCCVDTTLASRNVSAALKDSLGAPYADASGGWVDPWNREVRDYTAALAADLLSKGFDEVVLNHVEHPDAAVTYTRTVSGALDRTACVTNFAIAVREELSDTLEKTGGHLDAVLTHDAFTATASANGQTLTNFLKVFDRVIIATDTYGDDAKVFVDAHIDSTLRYVPRMTWIFSGASWVLDTTVAANEG